ncbi:hypothetical protein B9W68_25935 [Streptomyces sp. CS227]|nr:hypothetical protein B9W68_25935 [Streptomyces sp. CS227]
MTVDGFGLERAEQLARLERFAEEVAPVVRREPPTTLGAEETGRSDPYGGSARPRSGAVFRASRPHKGAAGGPRGRRKVGAVREGTSEGGTG